MDAGYLPGLVWPAAATGAESLSLKSRDSEGVATEVCGKKIQMHYKYSEQGSFSSVAFTTEAKVKKLVIFCLVLLSYASSRLHKC